MTMGNKTTYLKEILKIKWAMGRYVKKEINKNFKKLNGHYSF